MGKPHSNQNSTMMRAKVIRPHLMATYKPPELFDHIHIFLYRKGESLWVRFQQDEDLLLGFYVSSWSRFGSPSRVSKAAHKQLNHRNAERHLPWSDQWQRTSRSRVPGNTLRQTSQRRLEMAPSSEARKQRQPCLRRYKVSSLMRSICLQDPNGLELSHDGVHHRRNHF